jgi:hypothetical protein
MTHLATLKTGTRIPTKFCKTSSATGYFHTDFIAHKKTFVILGNTFLSRFTTVEFLEKMRFLTCPQSLQDTYHEAIAYSKGSESG